MMGSCWSNDATTSLAVTYSAVRECGASCGAAVPLSLESGPHQQICSLPRNKAEERTGQMTRSKLKCDLFQRKLLTVSSEKGAASYNLSDLAFGLV